MLLQIDDSGIRDLAASDFIRVSKRKEEMLKRMLTILLIYLFVLIAAFLFQRKMMYLPARYTQDQQETMNARLRLKPWPTADDMRGLTALSGPDEALGTVLVFHGNAGSAVHRTYFIDALQVLGYRVIIAEYPGYGARAGSPSETSLIEDAIVSAKAAVREFGEPLFLCGESLGSGVIAGIVASGEVPVAGLLLITPFDSMAKVAQHHYWFLPTKLMLLDEYQVTGNLKDFTRPVAVLMAERDEIVPNRSTLALFDALSAPKKLWRFERAGHNDLPMASEHRWWRETMQFIHR